MNAINVEDETINSCNGIFITNNTTFRLSEITFEDQSSLSLSPSVVIHAAVNNLSCPLYQRNSSFLSSPSFQDS